MPGPSKEGGGLEVEKKYKKGGMPYTPFKMKGISPLKHPTHKDHHEAKKLGDKISEDKKKLLKKYTGGMMPL